MRKGRIFRLAKAIEKLPVKCETPGGVKKPGFTMGAVEICGTPCCIGGHLRAMWPKEVHPDFIVSDTQREIMLVLGIDLLQAGSVYVPSGDTYSWCANPGSRRHISAKHAANMLRTLARTGVVDWVNTRGERT